MVWNVKSRSRDRGNVFEINRDDSTVVFGSEEGVKGDWLIYFSAG